ncbi:MAG: diadenylate cyclase CdaA [Oscillospiraceae bacterium]|jgi:diadenylate cyclase|nr:diadenylate cyclase CdaA [Oscillospiraceae bacterium]
MGSLMEYLKNIDLWNQIVIVFSSIEFRDILDILLVSVVVYYVFRIMQNTRAVQLAKGALLVVAIFLAVYLLNLKAMKRVLEAILSFGITALAVVFQPELRRALEQMGRIRIPFLSNLGRDEEVEMTKKTISILCEAAADLSIKKIGALIVIERKTKLGDIINTGTVIDAKLSPELIGNIFYPKSPLHDGAGILENNRMLAAACFLPVSDNMSISRELGTRHRAALGMSENSDALVLVVSEETGDITIAEDGRLNRKLSIEALRKVLEKGLLPDSSDESKRIPAFWRSKNNVGKEK